MDKLVDNLRLTRKPIFVVIDGALVDDIGKFFASNEIDARPIFCGSDHSLIISGPWLVVAGSNKGSISRAVMAAKRCRSGVCWAADCDERTMLRHMRKLNVVRVPDGSVVWFRHYDPDVLAFLAPLFDPEQAAKLFGPTHTIGFVLGRGAGTLLGRPDGLPEPKGGPIKLTDCQMREIDNRQRVISRRKIAIALREEFPTKLARKTDAELMSDVEKHDNSAEQIGVISERGVFQWAQLNIVTNGKINNDESLKQYLQRNGKELADRTLDSEFSRLLARINPLR